MTLCRNRDTTYHSAGCLDVAQDDIGCGCKTSHVFAFRNGFWGVNGFVLEIFQIKLYTNKIKKREDYMNEVYLFLTILVYLSCLILAFKLFGRVGVFAWMCIATILSNIEVLKYVTLFGMNATLGNVMFCSTFLATDILSERYGKSHARLAVWIGLFASAIFVVVSQTWLLFTPTAGLEESSNAMSVLFSCVPRVVIVSLVTYVIVQFLDIKIYHFIWSVTEKHFGNKKSLLWLRNTASSLVSIMINAFLFNFFAFYEFGGVLSFLNHSLVVDFVTVIQFSLVTFIFMFVTILLDTPFVYLARKIKRVGVLLPHGIDKENENVSLKNDNEHNEVLDEKLK